MQQHLLRLLGTVLMINVATIQPMAGKFKVKVVNDLGIMTPATVSFEWSNPDAVPQSKKIYKNAEFDCFIPNDVTIQVKTKDKKQAFPYSCTSLKGKDIHIVKKEDSNIGLTLKNAKVIAPKKQKVSAHKMTDFDMDYTVQILDGEGTKIAKSTFATNTRGPLTKSLYVRLNKETEEGELKRYNNNIIKVTKTHEKGRSTQSFTIHSNEFPYGFQPQYQMWFVDDNKVQIIDPNNPSKMPVKEYELQEFNTPPALPASPIPHL